MTEEETVVDCRLVYYDDTSSEPVKVRCSTVMSGDEIRVVPLEDVTLHPVKPGSLVRWSIAEYVLHEMRTASYGNGATVTIAAGKT